MTNMTSTGLRPALDATLDARSENLLQARLIFDPSPEEDSLLEHIVALLRTGADPAERAARMSSLLTELSQSNLREGSFEQRIAGVLDHAVAAMHAAGIRSALTVKAAARQLRPHLRVIAESRTSRVEAQEFFLAACAVRDVVAQLSDDVLLGDGLRNELGAGRHELLLSLIAPTVETA